MIMLEIMSVKTKPNKQNLSLCSGGIKSELLLINRNQLSLCWAEYIVISHILFLVLTLRKVGRVMHIHTLLQRTILMPWDL